MDTSGLNVVVIYEPDVADTILAECSCDTASYPPSDITEEQICFIADEEATVPVLVIVNAFVELSMKPKNPNFIELENNDMLDYSSQQNKLKIDEVSSLIFS
jgi:hypothetical protein